MSWDGLPAELRAAMAEHLTAKQLEVMRLMAQGQSISGISRVLDIDRKTVRERFESGARKLRKAGVAVPA